MFNSSGAERKENMKPLAIDYCLRGVLLLECFYEQEKEDAFKSGK